jgi:hypothetical protein
MATTTRSSIRVKPDFFLFSVCADIFLFLSVTAASAAFPFVFAFLSFGRPSRLVEDSRAAIPPAGVVV